MIDAGENKEDERNSRRAQSTAEEFLPGIRGATRFPGVHSVCHNSGTRGSDPVSTRRKREEGINLAGGSSSGRRSSAAAISRIRSATDFHCDSTSRRARGGGRRLAKPEPEGRKGSNGAATARASTGRVRACTQTRVHVRTQYTRVHT